MANQLLSELAQQTTPALTDALYLVRDPGGTEVDHYVTSADLFKIPDGGLVNLSSIIHDDVAPQGLRLPQAASAAPASPSSGEGYLAWDTSGNQVIAYNGAAWAAVGGGSGDALVANPLSQFAATTSAQLAGVISNETGSGELVFGTSPTLVTPALGTPASGVLTNATGLPVTGLANGTDGELITWSATGVAETVAVGTATHVLTSNGVGVAPTFQAAGGGSGDALVANPLSQFAATTSAQLAGVISDETGSSLLVFNTSPTLVTPALGTPSAAVLTNATGLPVTGLANGTDGELITWSAAGVAETVAVGTATHVLTSNGVGVAPTFQAAAGGAFDSTAVDSTTWSDASQTGVIWTWDLSTTNVRMEFTNDDILLAASEVYFGSAMAQATDLRISGGAASNTIYASTRDIHISTNGQSVHLGKVSDTATGLSIDSTDGSVIHGSTLDDATGNEIAFDLQYTTNKATSGNDTGLLINLTDTASPGTSLLQDWQVGGVSKATMNPLGGLHVDKAGGFGATAGIVFGDGDAGIHETADDTLAFRFGGTDWQKMYISAGVNHLEFFGNTRIKTTSSSYALNLGVAGGGQVKLENGVLMFQETTTPTPLVNYGAIYTKTDNKLYFQDGAGTEHEIAFV